MIDINEYELEVLRMLAGVTPWQKGAWVNACVEYLGDIGLCTRFPPYEITQQGKDYLDEQRSVS